MELGDQGAARGVLDAVVGPEERGLGFGGTGLGFEFQALGFGVQDCVGGGEGLGAVVLACEGAVVCGVVVAGGDGGFEGEAEEGVDYGCDGTAAVDCEGAVLGMLLARKVGLGMHRLGRRTGSQKSSCMSITNRAESGGREADMIVEECRLD